MDHNPSTGAGGSGRRPVATAPDQPPDQGLLCDPAEPAPPAGSHGATASPAVPGPAPALDLDAVSDYVPALDDLALDYGPTPDIDAARDYDKALDYDNLASLATAAHRGPAQHGPPSEPAGGPGPGPATATAAATVAAESPPPAPASAPGPGSAPAGAPATRGGLRLAPAPAPASVPAAGLGPASAAATATAGLPGLAAAPPRAPVRAAGLAPAPAPDSVPVAAVATRPAPEPASALRPAHAREPGPVPQPAQGPGLAQDPGPAQGAGLAQVLEPAPDSMPAPDAAPGLAAAQAASTEEDPWADDLTAAQVSSATYWRRRLVALLIGIAVLTLLVWAVSGALHGSGPGQAPSHRGRPSAGPGGTHRDKDGRRSAQHSARHTGGGSHAASGGTPQSLSGSAPGRAQTTSAGAGHPGMLSGIVDVLTIPGPRQRDGSTARRTPSQRSVARTPEHRSVARAPERRAVVPAPAPHVAACARGDVVLSLASPRIWYQRGRWPLFGVAAVSTGNRPCRLNMGARFATVVVTSGRTRIWGSADCVRGTGSQMVTLSRGMPAVRWIYWDRATSAPGCRSPRRTAPQGAYTAIAFDGQLSSQVMVFMLDRPGTALP